MDKLKEPGRRNWYAAQSLEHGWPRSALAMQLGTRAYSRAGATICPTSNEGDDVLGIGDLFP